MTETGTAGKWLELEENDLYCFDEEAADRAVRFIETFCIHSEGEFAGQPFHLLYWQRRIIRDLFGWKRRNDSTRRFRELYIIGGKGMGKSPLLAAIGLYMFFADGEAAPHIISLASTYEQAQLTFNEAKNYIDSHPQLKKRAKITQYRIMGKRGEKWTINSGKPKGRSGSRPHCVVADEQMEWDSPEAFKRVTKNIIKRRQPLVLVATNAGESQSTYAYSQYERAKKVLSGEIQDDSLYPVIFEAPADLAWDSEEAAAAANPSLGQIVPFHRLAPEIAKARLSEEDETEYRRLYLSQWPKKGGKKWIDLGEYDSCVGEVDTSKLRDAPLYVGYDGSEGDDLCSIVFCWTTPTDYYVVPRFYLPRQTADRYERRNGIPYSKWTKDIDLLDQRTIGPEVQQRIAADILAVAKVNRCKAVAYDAHRANPIIATLEKAGITCVPVRQGFSLTPGCEELARRLKERSIVIAPNAVARFCAENVEVTYDQRGNYWPVKPCRNGKYAGRPEAKIDFIAALVTALTEARKQQFEVAKKQWHGKAFLV